MKSYFLIPIFAILLFTCASEPQEVHVKNKFSISLPSFLESTRQLHPYASLQYQNLRQELYFIVFDVIDHLDEDFSELAVNIDDLFELTVSDFTGKIYLNNISEITEIEINGLNARKVDINGSMGGGNAYILIALVEGKNDFYAIMSWTTARNKIRYEKIMKEAIYSFDEL